MTASRSWGLVTADWHLRRHDRVWTRKENLYGDAAYGIAQVLDIALKEQVSVVLLLGDVADERFQYSDAIQLLRQAMSQFEENNIQVWYIQGQHEKSNPPLLAAVHEWPVHIHDKLMKTPLGPLYGLDYQPPTQIANALQSVPSEARILATHQVFKEYMGESRGFASMLDVPDNVNKILTGDFHSHRFDRFDNRLALSPGPLCAQSIAEFGLKGVWLLKEDGTYDTAELKARKYYEVLLETEEQLDQFLLGWPNNPCRAPQYMVPTEIAMSVLRVRYRNDIPDAVKKLEDTTASSVHLFAEPYVPQLCEVPLDANKRVKAVLGGGMAGCLEAFYQDDEEVYRTALRLWNSRAVPDELRNLTKELLSATD